MCCDEDEEGEELLRGMSVFASHNNENSCGQGMYFFRISEVGDFNTLSCNRCDDLNADLLQVEFQGFMYALTRAFQGSTHTHHLTPAVLLAVVPKTSPIAFKNASDVALPLLNGTEGCYKSI
jgi:hypothetical protein